MIFRAALLALDAKEYQVSPLAVAEILTGLLYLFLLNVVHEWYPVQVFIRIS